MILRVRDELSEQYTRRWSGWRCWTSVEQCRSVVYEGAAGLREATTQGGTTA